MARPGPSELSVFPLHRAAYSSATSTRYLQAVNRFFVWLSDLGEDPSSLSELDELLCEFIHHLWSSSPSGSPQAALSVRYGLQLRWPQIKKRGLPLSDLAIKGWQRLRPSEPRLPISWPVAVLIACRLAHHGLLRASVGVLLAFECYLRAGELLGLRRCDVVLPGDSGLEDDVLPFVRLRRTKTGAEQSVSVRDPAVIRLLAVLCRHTADDDLLFPFSQRWLRTWFQFCLQQLQLHGDFGLHSLRHGGATRDYMRGAPVEEILFRGRWASTKTTRRYVQCTRARLLDQRLPRVLASAAKAAAKDPFASIFHFLRLRQ